MPTDLERDWVTRAYLRLTDVRHLQETQSSGTTHSDDQDAPDLRWPGYLGDNFVPGHGVLAIYNVHREFRSRNLIHDPRGVVDLLVDATSRLRDAPALDDSTVDAYVCDHRPAYEVGLSGGWGVANHLVPALGACGVPFSEEGIRRIAYVNTSCCQFPELHKEDDDNKRKRTLRRLCSNAHSVSEVVKMLRPAVVLNASSVANKALRIAGVGGTVATIFFNQNSGSLEAPVTFPDQQQLPRGTRRADWVEALQEHMVSRWPTPPS